MNQNPAKVNWLESTVSTSVLARESLVKSPDTLAVFAAKIQTGGAGRLGRSWQSLEGNLHISIAIPASFITEPFRPLLSIITGNICVKWVEKYFGVAPLLKWPNDVFLNGKKLGGILCEASITGVEWNGAVIGVGINIQAAPRLEGEYQATSLQKETGYSKPARMCADLFAEFFLSELSKLNLQNIYSDYLLYSTSEGQLWKDGSNQYYSQLSFKNDFHLRLIDEAKITYEVSSSENKYKWSMMTGEKLLVADVGNTSTKIGVVSFLEDKFEIIDQYRVSSFNSDSGLEDWLKSRISEQIHPVIHVSSVNAKQFDFFSSILATIGIFARKIEKRPVYSGSSKYKLTDIGMDRFTAVEGVLAMRGRAVFGGACVLVSLGTATTIDFIDAQGVHIGGLIGVGMETSLRALNVSTDLLPKLDLLDAAKTIPDIGESTEQAMKNASLRMTTSWVEQEVSRFSKSINVGPQHLTLILSGGFAKTVKDLLNTQADVREISDLVLQGAAFLALNGR